MKRGFKVLLIILGILIVIGLGILFYFKAPDMKPLSSYFPWSSSVYRVNFKGHYDTPPTISPDVQKALDQDRVKYEALILQNDKHEDQIITQLKSAGITVGSAYIVDTDSGEQMLALNIPFTGNLLGSNSFVQDMANSMVKLADLKALDLAGLAYVNMFLSDSEDRVIFGVTARTSDIQSYRSGKTNLEQFFASTAAGVESRSAALDAISGGLK